MLGAWKARAGGGQRQLPLRRRRAALRAGRQRRPGGRSTTARSPPPSPRCCPTCPAWSAAAPGRRRLGRRPAAGRRPLRGRPGRGAPRSPRGPVARRPLHPLHGRDHGHAQGHAVAAGRLPGHRPRRRRPDATQIVAAARGRGPGLRTLPSAPVHARRRPLERPVGLDVGRHGRGPGRPHPPRPGRRPGHLRARAGDAAPDRRRPVRPPAARRARRPRRLRPLVAALPALGRGRPVAAGEGPPVGRRCPGSASSTSSGSSETGRQAVAGGDAAVPARAARRWCCRTTARRRPGPGRPTRSAGWPRPAGCRSGYLGDEAKTAATFPVIDGVRHAVAGDRVRLRPTARSTCWAATRSRSTPAARRCSPRRSSRRSPSHPAVADAVVVGRPERALGSTRSWRCCRPARAPPRPTTTSCAPTAARCWPATRCPRRSAGSTASSAPPPASPTTPGPRVVAAGRPDRLSVGELVGGVAPASGVARARRPSGRPALADQAVDEVLGGRAAFPHRRQERAPVAVGLQQHAVDARAQRATRASWPARQRGSGRRGPTP